MNYKERIQTAPAMSAMIEKLHAKYHKKTMVHCGAYNVANLLYSNMSQPGKKITILQDQKNREGSKNKFLSASEAIFLSVEFVEGLDLKGSDYPLNIIAKIPFENTSDEFIKARNDHDNWKRYNLFAAVEVMQAAGRCTRKPDDFSETYILDESWKRFYGRMSKKFQPWFKIAIKNVNLD
jgi:Rad3-related DNA helicase